MVWFVAMALSAFGADDRGVSIERPGDGTVAVRVDRQRPTRVDEQTTLMLDFGDTNLFELALFFADLMGKNLLVTNEKELTARTVRLVGHDEVTAGEAWQAFLTALRASGFTADEGPNLTRIVPSQEGPRGWVPIDDAARGHQGLVTQILPLTNAQASDVAGIIAPLLSAEAVVVPYAPANRLIVTDTAAQVAKAAALVERIDWAAPASTVVRTELRYADAEEVRAILLALYPTAAPTRPAREAPRRRARRGSRPATPSGPATVGERSRHIEQILADPRTNSLVVLANPSGHEAVAEIVTSLDVDADPDARKQLHVVPLKFAMADELLGVLNSLQGSRRSAEPARRPADDAAQDVALALDDDVRLAADPATNAIIVVADPVAFAAVGRLIGDLDVVRGQVFIDAVFVELTHSGGREIGFEAQILPGPDGTPGVSLGLDQSRSVSALSITPDVLSGLAAGVFGPALEVVGLDGVPIQVPRFGIALRALQTHSDVQVMGNPSLLTLDHNEAELSIGQRIPFPVNNQVPTVGPAVTTIERQDVGTVLTVTPHINSEALVRWTWRSPSRRSRAPSTPCRSRRTAASTPA